MVMNADGTGSVPLSTTTRARHPDWSPDGARLVFHSDIETPCTGGLCDPEVYVVSADGSGEANITNTENNVRDSHPAWSPDGTRIAFNRWPVGVRGTDVYAMDPDGGDIVMITNEVGSSRLGSLCTPATPAPRELRHCMPPWSPPTSSARRRTARTARHLPSRHATRPRSARPCSRSARPMRTVRPPTWPVSCGCK